MSPQRSAQTLNPALPVNLYSHSSKQQTGCGIDSDTRLFQMKAFSAPASHPKSSSSSQVTRISKAIWKQVMPAEGTLCTLLQIREYLAELYCEYTYSEEAPLKHVQNMEKSLWIAVLPGLHFHNLKLKCSDLTSYNTRRRHNIYEVWCMHGTLEEAQKVLLEPTGSQHFEFNGISGHSEHHTE